MQSSTDFNVVSHFILVQRCCRPRKTSLEKPPHACTQRIPARMLSARLGDTVQLKGTLCTPVGGR